MMIARTRHLLVAGGLLAAAALGACSNDDNGGGGPNPTPGEAALTGNIAADRSLSADTTYTISGYVKVQAGATLTIPAGTVLLGDTTVPGSSLWILRGASIEATGSASEPIVFTSARSTGDQPATGAG